MVSIDSWKYSVKEQDEVVVEVASVEIGWRLAP
jgi:hypothetical protein